MRGVQIVCFFMESDMKRAHHLERLLAHQALPPDTKCQVFPGTFDDHMTGILDYLAEQKARLAPAFVMIDPFGSKGSPMHLIERILQNSKSECMISFMYEPIRRFHQQSEFKPHLDELFGTAEWEQCLDMEESDAKKTVSPQPVFETTKNTWRKLCRFVRAMETKSPYLYDLLCD